MPCRERWLKRTEETIVTTKKVRKVGPGKKVIGEVGGDTTVQKVEWTNDMINKKVKGIAVSRGKRGTDRSAQVKMLEELLEKVKTASKKVEIMVQLISCLFDSNPNMLSFLNVDLWTKTTAYILDLLALLKENPDISLHEGPELETEADEFEAQENEDGEVMPITANLLGFLERLDDELNKSYQSLDPSLNEYLFRLKDEGTILAVAEGVQAYYTVRESWKSVASAARRRIEHLYWRTMAMMRAGATNAQAAVECKQFCQDFNDSCVMVYRHGDERTKTRVMLCHVFHHAQKGDFYQARDMLLMSHLQDSIQMSDIGLINRTMVQLGLAAFQHGLITDAHNCLAEVLAGSRGKELLAQGLSSSRYSCSPCIAPVN